MESVFIAGLLKHQPDAIAMQIAVWDKSTLQHVLVNRVRSIGKPDLAADALEAKAQEVLRRFSGADHLMRRELLNRVCTGLDVDTTTVMTWADLDALGIEIEAKAVALQRRQNRKGFQGESIEDLVTYVMKRLFNQFSKDFAKKSATEQEKIAANMLEVLQEMPREHRERVLQTAQIDELTSKALRRAMATGALGAGLTALVQTAGFGAYIFASQALAAIAGLVGLTLPFGAYITLSSTIALLSGPAGWVLLAGAVAFLARKANRDTRAALTPFLVAQVVMAAGNDVPVEATGDALIAALDRAVKGS